MLKRTAAIGLWVLGTAAAGTEVATAPVFSELGECASPNDLTDGGAVVGVVTMGGDTRALLWTDLYGAVDLGTLGGSSGWAEAANESGVVVGFATLPDGTHHAFSWTRSGGMTLLRPDGRSEGSVAHDVNERGDVLVTDFFVERPAGGSWRTVYRVFVWTADGGMAQVGSAGQVLNYTAVLTERGEVLGQTSLPDYSNRRPFIWTREHGLVDLSAVLSPNARPIAVNGAGHILGNVYPPGSASPQGSFVWTPEFGVTDLGITQAVAMSDGGRVVGTGRLADGSARAMAWTREGGTLELGTLPGGVMSWAESVNDGGMVVGASDAADGRVHAFSWTQQGGMVDLGGPVGGSSFAFRSNDNGRVVGRGWGADGPETVLLWKTDVVSEVDVLLRMIEELAAMHGVSDTVTAAAEAVESALGSASMCDALARLMAVVTDAAGPDASDRKVRAVVASASDLRTMLRCP